MLTDVEERRQAVYRAEVASGVAIMRPLASIHDAQTYADHILKQRYWRNLSAVRRATLAYIPSWEMESECGAEHGSADVALTIGGLCEGTLLHELAHCARRDMDNGHRGPFLRLQFRLIEMETAAWRDVMLPKYAQELLARELVTGRETWLKPWLG